MVEHCSLSLIGPEAFQKLLLKTEEYVKAYMQNYKDSSHDYAHVERVRKTALQLSRTISAPLNQQLVELAALLHDVGDFKFLAPGEDGETFLRNFMAQADYPECLQDAVVWINKRVSFRHELECPNDHFGPYQLELFCVQDADRLEAIGAIGIARCFSFNGARNLPMCDKDTLPMVEMTGEKYNQVLKNAKANARNHFYEKLLKISGMLKTDAGKEEGSRRHELMKKFIAEFDRECDLDSTPLSLF
jgi:uncharacterized protein